MYIQLSFDESEAWRELRKHRDRAVGVLGAAMVEETLEEALTCLWRKDERKKAKDTTIWENFVASGEFTFSVKIALAYLNKLIGPFVHSDLTYIRKIRNRFAHRIRDPNADEWKPVTFRVDEIAAWCRNIKVVDKVKVVVGGRRLTAKKDPKRRFITAVAIYTAIFELYTANPDKEGKVIDRLLLLDLPVPP